MFRMKTQEGGMPHKHNKPRIYESAGQADMIIETALLIMMLFHSRARLYFSLFGYWNLFL